MGYADVGRKLVLGLKHGDRADIARAAGPGWRGRGPISCTTIPCWCPVPLHWPGWQRGATTSRRFWRMALARETGLSVAADALMRKRATPTPGRARQDARFENLTDAIAPHPRHGHRLRGARSS
jgi:predicted amidophosphoribosyltransferase